MKCFDQIKLQLRMDKTGDASLPLDKKFGSNEKTAK
jgi:hypothetical protein